MITGASIILTRGLAVLATVVGVCGAGLTSSFAQDNQQGYATPKPPADFKLDVRDSTPDWGPYTPKKAPDGAPNILIVLYDDTGMAAWSPYGGRINMPTMDKLAKNGLTYSQWHTTSLCSPTRSCFLTGRNHHLNGMSCITEGSQGYPGWSGRIPPQCASMADILRDNGWSTFWLGKDHNVAEPDVAPGASREEWPLRKGFDRFYGFIGGETSQWFPDLVEDNRFIDQPYMPDQMVAEGPMRAQSGKFTLSGDGLCVGYDSGDAVSSQYKVPGKFHDGTIQVVGVTVEKAQYLDLEKEAQRALSRD
jgi:hypothetical protein